MSVIMIFDGKENEDDIYTAVDYIKTFCESLRGHAMKISNFEKKKMIPLLEEQQESYEKIKIGYICKKMFEDNFTK